MSSPTPNPADATIRWSGAGPRSRGQRRTADLAALFGAKGVFIVGRAPECELVLPHPSVSRHHALLTRGSSGIRLEDLGSVNGVLVNGGRISEPVTLREHMLVGIGPFLFHHAAGVVHILDNSQSLRLEARGLEKVILTADGQSRKLLDNINLAIEPGEFVSLLGPSGSGKSTLMDCLNGRRPATGGNVLANGENFYQHFDSFRQSLGYVPQKDIVHTQLAVGQALYYTAKLRLPVDTTRQELQTRVASVVQQMELGPHQATLIGQLSGGQIKRVSLGAELLARPCLLYIDEATSGLDAGTEARMMRLFRQLADEGKSVICITHNVDNVDLCNLIIILVRGRLAFFGPPAEARAYFGVSRVSEVYDALAGKEAADWEKQFQACSLHRDFVAARLASPALSPVAAKAVDLNQGATQLGTVLPLPSAPVDGRKHFPFWHQFRVLTTRYLELIWRERGNLRLLFLQAPIVALVILAGFLNKPYQEKVLVPRRLDDKERIHLKRLADLVDRFKIEAGDALAALDPKIVKFLDLPAKALETQGPVVPEHIIVNPRFTYMLLFLMVVIVLWFGCNNASKEIVKEAAIYGRERAVNLGIVPYLASKFLVLSGVTALQALLLMTCIYGPMLVLHQFGWDFPHEAYRLSYLNEFGLLVVLGMAGVALGLCLSAVVSSPDQANALLPYVLIPQIILGGGILPVRDGPLYYLAMVFSPAYWGYRGIHRGATALPPDIPAAMNYNDSPLLTIAALALQTLVLIALTGWFLRQKDVRKD